MNNYDILLDKINIIMHRNGIQLEKLLASYEENKSKISEIESEKADKEDEITTISGLIEILENKKQFKRGIINSKLSENIIYILLGLFLAIFNIVVLFLMNVTIFNIIGLSCGVALLVISISCIVKDYRKINANLETQLHNRSLEDLKEEKERLKAQNIKNKQELIFLKKNKENLQALIDNLKREIAQFRYYKSTIIDSKNETIAKIIQEPNIEQKMNAGYENSPVVKLIRTKMEVEGE